MECEVVGVMERPDVLEGSAQDATMGKEPVVEGTGRVQVTLKECYCGWRRERAAYCGKHDGK